MNEKQAELDEVVAEFSAVKSALEERIASVSSELENERSKSLQSKSELETEMRQFADDMVLKLEDEMEKRRSVEAELSQLSSSHATFEIELKASIDQRDEMASCLAINESRIAEVTESLRYFEAKNKELELALSSICDEHSAVRS